jgi:hypothetical protein
MQIGDCGVFGLTTADRDCGVLIVAPNSQSTIDNLNPQSAVIKIGNQQSEIANR